MKSDVLFICFRMYSVGDMSLLYSKCVTDIKKENSPKPQTTVMCKTVPQGLSEVINVFLQLWICL